MKPESAAAQRLQRPIRLTQILSAAFRLRTCLRKGYSEESGIPFGLAFHKNSYVGRTFIKPTQKERESSVKIKLSVLESVVKENELSSLTIPLSAEQRFRI